jgi:SAM-dependent methyltransferase
VDLKEAEILGTSIDDHWYYISKGRALCHFLGDIKVDQVLDVGAGSGVFSRLLLDEGYCDSAICVDSNYDEEKAETHRGKPIEFVRSAMSVAPKLVLMMDVLEHVADDTALLRDYVEQLEPGGHVLITVPAFQFMWSGHDVFLEHFRRYTIKSLEAVVVQSGLDPVKSRYFFGGLFPALAVMRGIRKLSFNRGSLNARSELKTYPGWLNNALITFHDIERRTLFGVNKFFGLSAFCLCRKGQSNDGS